jgi:glycerol dehydrogenase
MTVTAVFQNNSEHRAYALDFLCEETLRLGTRAVVLLDPDLDGFVRALVESEMRGAGLIVSRSRSAAVGEEVERVLAVIRAVGADVIVGVGVGETLDVVIEAAETAGLSALIAPTPATFLEP